MSKADIDYELFLDCVHCGLCTAACPTYVENGDENDSPRGRIYLMRAVTDGRLELTEQVKGHLDLCLDCRSCETACPSGVQYGKLIEPFRIHLQQTGQSESLGFLQRFMLFRITPYVQRMQVGPGAARFMQWTGMDWLMRRLGLFAAHAVIAPANAQHAAPAQGVSRLAAGTAPGRGAAAGAWPCFLAVRPTRSFRKRLCTRPGSCRKTAAMSLFQEIRAAAALCITTPPGRPGQDVRGAKLPGLLSASRPGCGRRHFHAAGCGAMLKDYGHLLHTMAAQAGAKFAHKVKDISEFLMELGPIKPGASAEDEGGVSRCVSPLPRPADPQAARQLLAMIPNWRWCR